MKAITLDYQKENREFLVLKSYSTDYLITSFDFKKTEHLVQSLFNVFLNFIPHKESAFFSIKTTESRSGKDFDACLGKFFTNQCRELLDKFVIVAVGNRNMSTCITCLDQFIKGKL